MDFTLLNEELKAKKAEAYVYFDYEKRHPLSKKEFADAPLSRKLIFVYRLNEEKAHLIAHLIDAPFLTNRPGYCVDIYHDYKEMLSLLEKELKGLKTLMVDYSPDGLLPRVSLADYGSLEYLRKLGKEFVSSGDYLQRTTAIYGKRSLELQLDANRLNLLIKDEAFRKIAEDIKTKGESDELEIQNFITRRYQEEGMVYDDPPIVAVGKRASNPHFSPSPENHIAIKEGDLVLIDMWAKIDDPLAVYSDITWMGYVGREVPEIYAEAFQTLKTSIDMALSFLSENLPKRRVEGHEVDRLVRDYIKSKGYGPYFTHRTGHNIGVDVSPHGPGANIDDFESRDERALIPHTSFSLEPGIYTETFGMRSETDVYVDENLKPVVVGGRQEEILPLLGL